MPKVVRRSICDCCSDGDDECTDGEQAGDLERASKLYEDDGQLEKAARTACDLRQYERAADLYARAGVSSEAGRARAEGLFATWEKMFAEPFRGITTDGHAIRDLFVRKPEGAPTQAMIDAVGALLARLTPAQKAAACFPVGAWP